MDSSDTTCAVHCCSSCALPDICADDFMCTACYLHWCEVDDSERFDD